MRIYNIRGGFANNSSSTHSLAFLPEGTKDSAGNTPEDANNEIGGFGWQQFVAASSEAKARWLAQHFIWATKITCGEAITRVMVQHWLGFDPARYPDDYVDHQSVIALPREWSGVGIDQEFFDELKTFVMRPGVVVLGGNDNDDSPRGPINYHVAMSGMIDRPRDSQIVARKDSRGFWTVFDRYDGTKLRVAFDTDTIRRLENTDVSKTDTPELVDLKITNKCHMGCDFCYQDSVPNGAHANSTFVYNAVAYMRAARVFEVAIGGGEPTLYPDFVELLASCRTNGIVPNFTTRNLAWVHQPTKLHAILQHVGGWAFSTENADDVAKLHALWTLHDLPRAKRPSIQYVIGVDTQGNFEAVVRACRQAGFRLTLLGAKNTGRGVTKSWDRYNWLEALKPGDGEYLSFGIDTALAQQYGQAIADAGIPDWCYTVHEGKSSMYIDAVEGYIAPSSYSPADTRVKVEKSYDLDTCIAKHYPNW